MCKYRFSFVIKSGKQASMKDYFSSQNPATYSNSNPKASLITESLITDLIVGEGLPLRLVESTGFLNF